jgi:hypothetical protein
MKNRETAKNDFIKLALVIYKNEKVNIDKYKTEYPLNPSI